MILVIQNGHHIPTIGQYLSDPYEIIKNHECDAYLSKLPNYQLVIILGGHQTVTHLEIYPELQAVIRIIKTCLNQHRALIGICLGCQLIAYVLGAKISNSVAKTGFDVEILGHKRVFRSHLDFIADPGPNIRIRHRFQDTIYLFDYTPHVVGIQCHPDTSPESIATLCNHAPSIEYAQQNADLIEYQNRDILQQLIAIALSG